MMMRFIILFILLFGVGALVQWGGHDPGHLVLQWNGYTVETTATFLMGLVLAVTFFFFVWGRFWSFVMDMPYHFNHWRGRKREEEGLKTLFGAMEALAAGEAPKARRLAHQATRLLPDDRLSLMVKAEAATMEGDTGEARKHFLNLTQGAGTHFLGLRGLTTQAIREGDWEQVLTYASQAIEKHKKSPQIIRALLEANIHTGRYEEALKLLKKAEEVGVLQGWDTAFFAACLNVSWARQLREKKEFSRAIARLNMALADVPDFLLAAEMKISLLAQEGETTKARRVAEKFWQKYPVEAMFSRWMDCVLSTETPEKMVTLAEKMTRPRRHSAEGALALARACLRGGKPSRAREVLIKAIESTPVRPLYLELAQLEEKMPENSKVAQKWLARAARAAELPPPHETHSPAYARWCEMYTKNTRGLPSPESRGI